MHFFIFEFLPPEHRGPVGCGLLLVGLLVSGIGLAACIRHGFDHTEGLSYLIGGLVFNAIIVVLWALAPSD
jgi:hypothetical protein